VKGAARMNESTKSDLSQLIGLTCEQALARAQIRGSRRCGPFGLALGFKSATLANVIEPLFPAACHKDHDLTIAFLNRRDLDLSNLIPNPPDAHHAVTVTADYYAAWWPGKRPVLHMLDKTACRGLVWFAADEAPCWELSRPALPLIQAMSADTDWTPAHGAAVGKDGRFLLLAGGGTIGQDHCRARLRTGRLGLCRRRLCHRKCQVQAGRAAVYVRSTPDRYGRRIR
jgi:hypothetical protein